MCLDNYYKQDNIEKFICNVCNCEYEYFLNKKNVIGIGCGYKIKNGFYTCIKCIKVFVLKKIYKDKLSFKDQIPTIYKGILTDVIESTMFTTSSLTERIRPVICGYVIGNEYKKNSSGTLGCLVANDTNVFILCNNHSIATCNLAPIGTNVIQPSYKYGGRFDTDIIATLAKYIKVKFRTFLKKPTNYVDCALGMPKDQTLVSSNIALIGAPRGIISPKLNEAVRKVGFKTELTIGKITTLSATLEIQFPFSKTAIFKNQILTTKMSEKGDSGALLFNNNYKYAIGLLMGDNDTNSIYNPIQTVLKELNVRLVIDYKNI